VEAAATQPLEIEIAIMLDTIAPGSRVNVKIFKQPTNIAAAKTLVRLLSKDAEVIADNTRLQRIRKKHFSPIRRGGRDWGGQLIKQRPVKGNLGEAGTITATVDVLTDLRSVGRFVEVSPA
jgi:hypothetical protein